ncbi:MAG: hypothetical protein HY674_07775 [Chloroflexi bacterium]|nr:hypothetical protein [Chloroflexota bacterium]
MERFRLAQVVVCLSLLASEPAWAGEKIQFSRPSEKIELPKPSLKEDRLPPSLGARNTGSSGGDIDIPVAPPTFRPSAALQKKLGEYIDRRSNWIFYGPDSLQESADKDSPWPEFSLDKADHKPKKAVDRFLEEGNGRSNRSTDNESANLANKSDESSRNLMNPSSRNPDNGLSNAPMSEFNLNSYLHPSHADDMLSRPFNDSLHNFFAPPTLEDPSNLSRSTRLERKRQDQERAAEFQKLLQPRGMFNPLAGPIDPINLQPDATRQEINPILPKRFEDGSSTLGRSDNLDPARAFRPSANIGRPGSLEVYNPAMLGASSLSPAITAPSTPTVIFQPKPAVLEIPRRKF